MKFKKDAVTLYNSLVENPKNKKVQLNFDEKNKQAVIQYKLDKKVVCIKWRIK